MNDKRTLSLFVFIFSVTTALADTSHPATFQNHFYKATELFKSQNYVEAIQYYNKTIRLNQTAIKHILIKDLHT